eukprot:EG_transcript_17716
MARKVLLRLRAQASVCTSGHILPCVIPWLFELPKNSKRHNNRVVPGPAQNEGPATKENFQKNRPDQVCFLKTMPKKPKLLTGKGPGVLSLVFPCSSLDVVTKCHSPPKPPRFPSLGPLSME